MLGHVAVCNGETPAATVLTPPFHVTPAAYLPRQRKQHRRLCPAVVLYGISSCHRTALTDPLAPTDARSRFAHESGNNLEIAKGRTQMWRANGDTSIATPLNGGSPKQSSSLLTKRKVPQQGNGCIAVWLVMVCKAQGGGGTCAPQRCLTPLPVKPHSPSFFLAARTAHRRPSSVPTSSPFSTQQKGAQPRLRSWCLLDACVCACTDVCAYKCMSLLAHSWGREGAEVPARSPLHHPPLVKRKPTRLV